MKIKLEILKELYCPYSKKFLPIGHTLDLEADEYGNVIDSFWAEQIKFNDYNNNLKIIKPKNK